MTSDLECERISVGLQRVHLRVKKEMSTGEQTELAVLGKETQERVARVDVALGGVVVRGGDRAGVVGREGCARRRLHANTALAAASARWFAAPSRHRQSSVSCGTVSMRNGWMERKSVQVENAVKRDKKKAWQAVLTRFCEEKSRKKRWVELFEQRKMASGTNASGILIVMGLRFSFP